MSAVDVPTAWKRLLADAFFAAEEAGLGAAEVTWQSADGKNDEAVDFIGARMGQHAAQMEGLN